MKQLPESVVGVFIVNDDKVLLVRSPKWDKGKIWAVPGGHIEMGETIGDAAEREAFEEVGLEVSFEKVFCVWDNIYPPEFHEKKHFIFLECLCHAQSPKVLIDNLEIVEAKWVTIKDALDLPLESFTRKTLFLL